MAYIQEIEADQAEGDLKAVYDEMMEQWSGRLPAVLKVVGLHPQALKRLKDLNLSVTFGGSTLGRRREEMIAASISAWNDCIYWTVHHGEFLRAITRDDRLVYHLARDHRQAELEPQERAMLEFAHKLNFEPGKMNPGDVEALRAAGFDDRGVLDVVLVVALFNFMNRLSDGLGVSPQAKFVETKAKGDARVEAELASGPAAAAGK